MFFSKSPIIACVIVDMFLVMSCHGNKQLFLLYSVIRWPGELADFVVVMSTVSKFILFLSIFFAIVF